MATVLICDDERSICRMLEIALARCGHRIETVFSGEKAIARLDRSFYDVILTDIKMPPPDGIQVLRHAHHLSPETPVLLMTAVDDYEAAVAAVCAGGATDYIRKSPGLVDEVALAIQRALEKVSLRRENFALRRDAASRNSLDNLIGTSPANVKLKQRIHAVASTQSTVLISGESGTGKELVARAIHACSPRASAPFVSFNCGAFPEALLESELFGHVKGAFTGATQAHRGLLEVADSGTLFLDEIGDMPLPMQVKLVRVLQERSVRPLGSTRESLIDVRVLAATHRDLDREVAAGSFREDLYYRLNVIPLAVTPLREHPEDIPLLLAHFAERFTQAAGKPSRAIASSCLASLCAYPWPGNVRQLENSVECAVALQDGKDLWIDLPLERPKAFAAAASSSGATVDSIPPAAPPVLPDGVDMTTYVAAVERRLMQAALARSNNVQTHAADLLKISYRSFRHLMKKYSL
ncbi:MAG: sigma-54-dependent Fis family transcriptional regulator [Acidobacteriales bacterium]|nr:sigma-54-dependent Fis family transcriptional regulator [Terriglobales bacterium]